MKIRSDQLTHHLQRGLAPLYLVAGEDILLLQEAENAIRHAAVSTSFSERIRFSVDTGFDWIKFQQSIQNTSLFSDKQLIELDLTSSKLSDAGKKTLADYLQRPHADKLLLIRTGKLDAATQKTTWYKAAEKSGVIIPIWPLAPTQIPAWIQQRLQAVGLQADPEGLQLLALRTEGNLLATAQEIEKLSLLYPKGFLTTEHIQEASSNNARYHVFRLTDAVLQAQPTAIVRVVNGLQQAAAEPILVLWALTRETRQWIQWLQHLQKGQTLSQILAGNVLMEKRQHLIQRMLQRHTLANLYECLQRAAHIDQVIKGATSGAIWNEIMSLALLLANVRTC